MIILNLYGIYLYQNNFGFSVKLLLSLFGGLLFEPPPTIPSFSLQLDEGLRLYSPLFSYSIQFQHDQLSKYVQKIILIFSL